MFEDDFSNLKQEDDMLSYTCARCNRELHCKKNGVILVHYLDDDKEKGVDVLRAGDLYECPGCLSSVVVGLSVLEMLGDEMPEGFLNGRTVIEVRRGL